jgi:hypothetical protein
MSKFLARIVILILVAAPVLAQNDVQSSTTLGPRNLYLFDGAQALMAGEADEGVRLTRQGLVMAHGQREVKAGHANLCAGFLMLGQAETALVHCDWVLELDEFHWRTYNNRALVYLALDRYEESETDIIRGQELRPNSETLKEVKGLYLDEVEPVDEKITIDDRRNEPLSPVDKPQ